MSELDGRCLCGAVRITVRDLNPAVSACHCSMCRRWSGSAFMGFVAPADGATVTSPFVVRFGLRGMGVALSVSTSTASRNRFSISFASTPNRCSSSIISSPRS